MKNFVSLLTLATVTALSFFLGVISFANLTNNQNLNLALVGGVEEAKEPVYSFSIATSTLSGISSESYLLATLSENKISVITEKNSDEKFYIASISKLMTALIAYENIPLDVIINIEASDINKYSSSGFYKIGDILTGNELLKSMLIESNNDAAGALSRFVGTTTFVSLMNKKAEELGMFNTNFSNSIGTDPAEMNEIGNISTVNDLLILVHFIFGNHPEIFTTTRNEKRDITSFNGSFHHVATSTNQLLFDETFPYIILGGKTGSTPLADKNLILLYRNPDISNIIFVSIVLHSKDQFKDSLLLAEALPLKN